ncbi:efflux transporter outer membrane subunit [Caulobacter sp. KR2-114]|uniref:efflux transporter outer membrane subunit n=1 Tax=Caulobacter sp. KR2-114 TaxID=3400912 RepID=UPI003C062F01
MFRPLAASTLAVAALMSALPAAAFQVGQTYERPQVALPSAYRNAPPPAQGAAELEAWWASFGDPELTRIVERARAQNLDLEQARARILQARAQVKVATSRLLPSGELGAAAANQQQSLLSPIGAIGQHLPGYRRETDLYDLGASASWEIDLFGGLRRGREAARADAAATILQGEAVMLSVTAEAADAYLQARALQARVAVANRQLQTQRELVDLLQQRVAQGIAAERDLHQAQAAQEGVAASIPPLLAALEAQLNRLDVLMGAAPGTYRAELETVAPIPAAPALSVAETPADLLRRRPDVIAAEQRLVAANARVGVATAEYYPKISISGLLGLESVDSSNLFAGNAVQHQIGAGLRWRLFDFGRVDGEVAAAKGAKAEALAAYRQSVLTAAADVENAFSDLAQQQARAAALQRQVDDLTTARRQAEQAYEGGVASLIEVRDTDRDLLAAADQLVQARAGAARAAVAAYRALGGGWTPAVPGKAAGGR